MESSTAIFLINEAEVEVLGLVVADVFFLQCMHAEPRALRLEVDCNNFHCYARSQW